MEEKLSKIEKVLVGTLIGGITLSPLIPENYSLIPLSISALSAIPLLITGTYRITMPPKIDLDELNDYKL